MKEVTGGRKQWLRIAAAIGAFCLVAGVVAVAWFWRGVGNVEALVAAAGRGDAARVAKLIRSGVPPNGRLPKSDEWQWSLRRVECGHAKCQAERFVGTVKSAVRRRVDTARTTGIDCRYGPATGGETPLTVAAWNCRTNVCIVLLQNGADVNLKGEFGRSALLYAASNSDTGLCSVLLAAGADPNAVDDRGVPLLQGAVCGVYMSQGPYDRAGVAICKLLIGNGSSTSVESPDEFGLLACAAFHDDRPLFDYLLEAGASPNACTRPLHWTVVDGKGEFAKALLAKGARITGDELVAAAGRGDTNMCRILIEGGADIRSRVWRPALAAAQRNGYTNTFQYLWEAGAKEYDGR